MIRRDEEHILRKVLRTDIPGKRRRGRPKTRWKDFQATQLENYCVESGRGDGQGDVEKEDQQSYRRHYMMGKARGKEEEYWLTIVKHKEENIWEYNENK